MSLNIFSSIYSIILDSLDEKVLSKKQNYKFWSLLCLKDPKASRVYIRLGP